MFQYIVYIEILMRCFTFFTLKKNLVQICHTPTLSHSESATAQSPAAHGAQVPTVHRVHLCHLRGCGGMVVSEIRLHC